MKPIVIPIIIIGILIPVLFAGTYFGFDSDIGASISEKHLQDSYAIAERLYNNGQFENAANSYLYILDKDQTQEKAAHELGKMYNHSGQCQEAQEHYDKYIELFPESERIIEGHTLAQTCGQ